MKKIIGVAVIITMIHFLLYTVFELAGDIENAPLTSHRFGVHEELKKIGVKEAFKKDTIGGWDGQFYYHMSNDPFNRYGFAKHLDSNAYRMQRVGLSLWSRSVASLMGYKFFPPSMAIFSYFLLFVVALYFLARILLFYNLSPYWLLVWVFAPGTQITIFNYLPDAAADCFLFIAIYFYLNKDKKPWFIGMYSFAISLAALSREVYVLLPFFIFLFEFLSDFKMKRWRWISHITMALPGIIFLFWQIWLRHEFNVSPSNQAVGILDWPLKSWIWGLSRAHTVLDALLLVLFFSAIIIQSFLSIRILRNSIIENFGRSTAYFSLAISFLYLCFGHLVMQDWTGYLKPASLYFFLIPISYKILNLKMNFWFQRMTIFFVICSFLVLYFERIFPPFPEMAQIYSRRNASFGSTLPKSTNCITSIKGSIEVSLGEPLYKNDFLRRIFYRPYFLDFEVVFNNENNFEILSAKEKGDVQIDYEWRDQNNGILKVQSLPTKLQEVLPAHTQLKTGLMVRYPNSPGEYQLRVFLNQRECGDLSQYDSRLSWSQHIEVK